MNKILFLILFFINFSPEPEWQFQKKKDGIEIFTRSIEGSLFDEFKGITTIEKSSLKAVLAIILDVKNFTKLYPDCMNPKVLKQEGEYYDIHYIQTKGPFAIKDRDSVFEQKTEIDKNEKYARVTLKPLPGYIAENNDMVRVREGSGFWELSEDEKGNVKVVYQYHGEPGGDIPAWLVNSFVETHPYQTLKNLKNRLKMP